MWYSSKEIREILHITPQYLYLLKKNGKIKFKEIADGKYLYSLPENFNDDIEVDTENKIEVLDILKKAIQEGKNINIKIEISD
jgi:hypothetical protein